MILIGTDALIAFNVKSRRNSFRHTFTTHPCQLASAFFEQKLLTRRSLGRGAWTTVN